MKPAGLALLLCSLCATSVLAAQPADETPAWLRHTGNAGLSAQEVFDAFHSKGDSVAIKPVVAGPIPVAPAVFPIDFRTIDGRGNNPNNLGMAGTTDLRLTTVGYGDGHGTPAGADRRGARDISNLVNGQTQEFDNSQNISSFVWVWGQFVSHDMTLNRVASPAEEFDIPVPQCDPVFDARCTGTKVLPFQRSSSTLVDGIRQQINANSAFLDGSVVYGSDPTRGLALRTLDGTGHLKTSTDSLNLLPFNVDGLPNQPASTANFFLAGDTRTNENTALTALQTVMMREHNFWADSFRAGDPTLNDNQIYLRARAVVGAEIQLITYRDFLPILLGPNALSPYQGYDSTVDPRAAIVFTTAAFRVGHTLLPSVLQRFNARGVSIGDIALGQTFFNPTLISRLGIEPYLRGLAKQVPQEVDAYIIDSVRNFVTQGRRTGFDLASLNIQRGRDNGLPGYNQVRIDFGLPPKATFAEMTSNLDFQARLESAYSSPDDVDIWVGGLTEDHVNGGQVGETFATIIKNQFERTRDGDSFWYESYLDPATLATVQAQTLGTIIKRNCPTIGREVQDDVFHVPQ